MSDLLACSLLAVAAFLLGSVPWGVVVSRLFFHTDVREHGSGNIGTTNALRTLGKKGGAAVFLLDFGKGLLSGFLVWAVARLIVDGAGGFSLLSYETLRAVSFLACIWGHIFSPWLKFRGGKGIAVAVGCMFATFGPVPALIELALFAVVVALTRYVSAGSIAAAALCPFVSVVVFFGHPDAIALCTLAALTVVWAHRGNIGRLRAGTEARIGSSASRK